VSAKRGENTLHLIQYIQISTLLKDAITKNNNNKIVYIIFKAGSNMAKLGAFAKGLLIVFCVSYFLVIIEFLFIGNTALALLMLAGFLTVFFVVVFEYAKRKNKVP